jgi:hypothetical protein
MITSAVGGAGGSVSKTARGRTVSIGDDVGNSCSGIVDDDDGASQRKMLA